MGLEEFLFFRPDKQILVVQPTQSFQSPRIAPFPLLISHLIRIVVADFTSVNSFQEDLKFTSPSFYNLTPPPPPTSRPPTYDVQNYQTPTNTPNGTIPAENYYAATDIIKVFDKQKRFAQIRDTLRSFIRSRYPNF
jgi:hypothetical protein